MRRANKEEKQILQKWVKRFCLTDWAISFYVDCAPDEMMLQGCAGCTEWAETLKTARIEILSPIHYGKRVVPFDFEKTVVHELLHIKFCYWCQDNTFEDRVLHQVIEDLAKAYVETERADG